MFLNSIGPLNWFPSRLTELSEGIVNKDVGKGPENEFPLTSRYSKLWNPLMSEGNVDLNRLLAMPKIVKLVVKFSSGKREFTGELVV